MKNDLVAQLVQAVSARECAFHQGWNDGWDGYPEMSKKVMRLAAEIRNELVQGAAVREELEYWYNVAVNMLTDSQLDQYRLPGGSPRNRLDRTRGALNLGTPDKETYHFIKGGNNNYGACGKNLGNFTLFPDRVTCKNCKKTEVFHKRERLFAQIERRIIEKSIRKE